MVLIVVLLVGGRGVVDVESRKISDVTHMRRGCDTGHILVISVDVGGRDMFRGIGKGSVEKMCVFVPPFLYVYVSVVVL